MCLFFLRYYFSCTPLLFPTFSEMPAFCSAFIHLYFFIFNSCREMRTENVVGKDHSNLCLILAQTAFKSCSVVSTVLSYMLLRFSWFLLVSVTVAFQQNGLSPDN